MPTEVVLDYPAIVEFLSSEMEPAIEAAAGAPVEVSARGRAPVRTGALLDSIEVTSGQDGGMRVAEVHAIYYDVFQEKPARQLFRAQRTLEDALNDLPPVLL